MFDVCESFHPSKVPKSFGFFEGFAPNALRKAGGKGRPGNDLKTTQPPPDTWKAFSTERKEIWIHFVLCCHTSSLSLSLRSTNCKGNQEEPKVENVSNCQIGGLWMDRPGRSPSQSSNQSKFVSFEFQHLPGNYGGGGIRRGSIMSFTVCWFSVTPRCNISSSLLQMSLYWLALRWILSPLRLLIVHLQLV